MKILPAFLPSQRATNTLAFEDLMNRQYPLFVRFTLAEDKATLATAPLVSIRGEVPVAEKQTVQQTARSFGQWNGLPFCQPDSRYPFASRSVGAEKRVVNALPPYVQIFGHLIDGPTRNIAGNDDLVRYQFPFS
jgi:hypothetical protein